MAVVLVPVTQAESHLIQLNEGTEASDYGDKGLLHMSCLLHKGLLHMLCLS